MKVARQFVAALGLLAGTAVAGSLPIPLASQRTLVDLDVPGALEALERDHPQRYRRVMEEVEKARQLPPLDAKASLRKALVDGQSAGSQRFLLTFPAKRHLRVPVDDVEYKISAYFTDDPARLHKAR